MKRSLGLPLCFSRHKSQVPRSRDGYIRSPKSNTKKQTCMHRLTIVVHPLYLRRTKYDPACIINRKSEKLIAFLNLQRYDCWRVKILSFEIKIQNQTRCEDATSIELTMKAGRLQQRPSFIVHKRATSRDSMYQEQEQETGSFNFVFLFIVRFVV
jgi:hypothetical protein